MASLLQIRKRLREFLSIFWPVVTVQVVLDVRKVPEVLEEVVAVVVLRSAIVGRVIVGVVVIKCSSLDHVKVARTEDLIVDLGISGNAVRLGPELIFRRI